MTLHKWTEKELQAHILQMAEVLNWRTYHVYDSRRSNPGFPDLVMVRGERLIFAELKSEKGRVTAAQEEWLADLSEVHQLWAMPEVYVWRPSDLDTIEEVLR